MSNIKLKKGLKLKVKQTVYIKDNCYNEPSVGTLDPDTVLEVTGGPTRISDVPFKILKGGGSINRRKKDWRGWPVEEMQDITPEKNYRGFFFTQGHNTSSPYDFGSLSTDYYEVYLNDK